MAIRKRGRIDSWYLHMADKQSAYNKLSWTCTLNIYCLSNEQQSYLIIIIAGVEKIECKSIHKNVRQFKLYF